jgi:hypothetical protein
MASCRFFNYDCNKSEIAKLIRELEKLNLLPIHNADGNFIDVVLEEDTPIEEIQKLLILYDGVWL